MAQAIEFLVRHGYLVLFGFVLAEQAGLPVPALPVLLAGGALVRTGQLGAAGLLAACVSASLLSDLAWFEVGRRRGGRVMGVLCRISLEPDSCVRNTERFFARHGARSLLVAKFVPGLNTAAPPMAGIFGMRRAPFILYSTAGALLWVGTAAGLGYVFGDQLEEVLAWAETAGVRFGAVLGGALLLYLGVKLVQRQRFLRELRIARIAPEELRRRIELGEEIAVIDLRHSKDFALDPQTVPGAFHLPVEELGQRHHEIPEDRELVLLCT